MRIPFTPNQGQKDKVLNYAKIGMSEENIAALLDLPVKRVMRHFRKELRLGAAEGNLAVLESLHNLVISQTNMQAMSLWVKSRCGWRDTGAAMDKPTEITNVIEFGPRLNEPHPKE